MTGRIGFMQGRLSPLAGGKIQAFPAPYWREEFAAAEALGLRCIEWTIDHDGIADNPIMSPAGRAEMLDLARRHGVSIPSVTGDCFMQAPFWKLAETANLVNDFSNVAEACGALGARILVVPLVDNGSLQAPEHGRRLFEGMMGLWPRLRELNLMVAFELDLPPAEQAAFIALYPADCFGICYDIGNSAALGWDAEKEIGLLHPRIVTVHVKDRLRGGGTVPLGDGAAQLGAVFRLLRRAGYAGDYILQTARAADGDHAGALARYRDLVANLLEG
jgi:hexulose-6-phosphate isomerase